jgi:hypothetical protein
MINSLLSDFSATVRARCPPPDKTVRFWTARFRPLSESVWTIPEPHRRRIQMVKKLSSLSGV